MRARPWKRFTEDEQGAVTVDWVVLVGLVIVMVTVVVTIILPAPKQMAVSAGDSLTQGAATVPVVTFN